MAKQHIISSSAGDPRVKRLIEIGSNKNSLQACEASAARKLLRETGIQYPHDGCAITLSVLLQEAGFDCPNIYRAIDLGHYLKKSGWKQVPVGEQRAGDVGSTCREEARHGQDHIYLVLKNLNGDEMVIADNQAREPHFRWASGKGGKTPTRFFLRLS